MRRLVVAALAAAVAVGPVVLATPAPATSSSYTTTVAKVVVKDGPGRTHIATIDTRLYVPRDASPTHRVPAILMTHGFGLSKDAAEITATADYLARHDYIVLTWTSQGFGQSSGCIELDSYDYDVADAEDLVDQLLVPRHDVASDSHGLVLGMTGGSYGGGIVLTLASVDHRIRAIVPGRTWNDLSYSLDPNNYVVPGDPTGFTHSLESQGVYKEEWTSLFFADGNAAVVGGIPPTGQQQGGCPQEKAASGDPTQVAGVPCLNYPSVLCQTYADVTATGNATPAERALLESSSVSSHLGALDAATLILQGESDTLFNLDDEAATYFALKARHVPVAMMWNSGGHGGYDSLPGECDVYGGGDTGLDDCYLTQRTLTWFDHWLKGRPLGDFPDFTYFRDWVPFHGTGSDAVQYGAALTFPAQRDEVFTLSGSSALVPPGTPALAGTATFVNPPGGEPASYSETSNFSAPGSTPDLSGVAPRDVPGEYAAFTSPPFAQTVTSVGIPRATVRLSHVNGQDLVFFGKVYDVAPDGTAVLIKRLIAPVRVPAADVGRPVTFNLLGFAHEFAKGHAVRLELAATDQTSYDAKVPDVITVSTGRGSTFSLPVDRLPASRQRATSGAAAPSTRAHGATSGSLAATGLPTAVPVIGLALLLLAGVIGRRLVRRRYAAAGS